ncbi:hypothetical protein DL771_000636 [Monosporascus sp. 5C6A]|nr:hypothetical protein DL771_000636 [Monosporascus sp. 5C6A]
MKFLVSLAALQHSAGPGNFRGPCPMMNTLANHNLLPHDGRNITKQDVTKATGAALNFKESLASLADHLNRHNVLELDGSLSRLDAYFGNNHIFSEEVFEQTKKYWTEPVLDPEMLANSKLARQLDSKVFNPTYTFMETVENFSLGELAAPIIAFGNLQSGKVNRTLVEYFFVNERLPYELGWTTQEQALDTEDVLKVSTMISEATNLITPSKSDGVARRFSVVASARRFALWRLGKRYSFFNHGDSGIIDAKSRLFQTLSKVVAHKDTSQKHVWHLSAGDPQSLANFNLRLNVVIQVVGSRGDVQPFVALVQELRRHGYRVRLATHGTFSDFVRKAGLEFYSIGGDPADLMAYMVKNPGLIPKMRTLQEGEIQKKRKMVAEMLDGCWKSCIEPDPVSGRPFVAEVFIANPPSFAHIHCSQALGVPLHLMFPMPWTSTSAFPHPLANIEMRGSHLPTGVANYVSYSAVKFMTWQGLGDLVNSWRKTLGLKAVPSTAGPLLAERLRVPFTYCWSPALIPKPADWPPHIDVCGFFFRDPPKYEASPEIASFLRAGPPPVYIGFGSIVIDDPGKLTATILQAVRATGVRAIISRGWSKLGSDLANVDENVLFIGDCPHDWLFQHVAAMVHHGGAGTTACGLLNVRPTTIVLFFGDQPFWGAMVAAAGGGPRPTPQRQLNSDNLAEAIRFCLRPETAVAADSLGAQMRSESGVKAAVESFHAHLPVEELR